MSDRDELDELLWIELRHGLTKSVQSVDNDTVNTIEGQLTNLLSKYRELNKINKPLPRIKMWITNNKVNFMFFDKSTGKRVLLGQWLQGKGGTYDQ